VNLVHDNVLISNTRDNGCLLMCIGGGVDFVSRPVNAFFSSGNDRTSVNIDVICDTIVEDDEQFNLALSVPFTTMRVVVGSRSTATATITDSTSKITH